MLTSTPSLMALRRAGEPVSLMLSGRAISMYFVPVLSVPTLSTVVFSLP